MYKTHSKIVKVGSKIPVSENRTVINLTVRGTSFPDRYIGGTAFTIISSGTQVMHIDYMDGTGVHDTNLINGTNNIQLNTYYYKDLEDPTKIGTIDPTYMQERTIRIWFDYPYRITTFLIQNFGLYGDFPRNIGNYNLNALTFSQVYSLENFPTVFRGGNWTLLVLNNLSSIKPTVLPDWIGLSRISTLRLQNVFNLSGSPASTNVNSLSKVKDLKNLYLLTNSMGNNSFPTTLKDITTLENLYVNGNPFTIFPSAIGDCQQLKALVISDNTGAFGFNTTMTSWGAGIGNMTSLVSLTYATTTSNFPTTVPTGADTAIVLKNIIVKESYRTSQARTDAFVNNWYDFIVANASLVLGNTKFRQMVFDIGNLISTPTLRPSGGATPTVLVDPPTTPIQKIYYMCKKYGHMWTIRNLANTGIEIVMP
jgi:Leucine-rich repeat (LRR) protein